MSRNEERALDAALDGGRAVDEETASLARIARELELSFAVGAPPAPRERAMFVHGVAANGRKGFRPVRLAVPAAALLLLAALVGVAGRGALPGDALYPVREVLLEVGLAPPADELVDDRLGSADRLLERANAQPEGRAGEAHRLALRALETLSGVRRLVGELDLPDRTLALANVRMMEAAASDVIVDAAHSDGIASPSPSSEPGDDDSGAVVGSDDPGDTGTGSDDPGEDPGTGSDDPGDDPGGSDDPGDDPGGSDDPGDDPGGSDDPGDDPGGSDDPGEDPGGSDDPGDDGGSGSGGDGSGGSDSEGEDQSEYVSGGDGSGSSDPGASHPGDDGSDGGGSSPPPDDPGSDGDPGTTSPEDAG